MRIQVKDISKTIIKICNNILLNKSPEKSYIKVINQDRFLNEQDQKFLQDKMLFYQNDLILLNIVLTLHNFMEKSKKDLPKML